MIQNQTENNKRIAINTILLYFRMILILIVSLYTSRVVLNVLGVNDYGIQNVVGGFVSMFSMISGSMGTAIVRFLTYELGTGNKDKLAITFSTSINIQLITVFIILLLAEIFGVWFLNSQMNIPQERLCAANWVFQFSLASFCVGLISVPYNSIIIAYERMNIFAYFSIIEVILKLFIVYILVISPIDKLILYSILLFCVSLLMCILYSVYCNRNLPGTKYQMILDKEILKKMGTFTGWNYVGVCTYILRTQGLNLLMNLFFGVIVNAARGVATQVESAISLLINNLSLALSPQITKSYAQKDFQYMSKLINYGAKYSYFMVLVVITPILFETSAMLELWLTNVPQYAIVFTRLSLLIVLTDCICNTLTDALLASGDIKKLHIMVGFVVLPVIPVSYCLFKNNFPPYSCYLLCVFALIVKFLFEIKFVKETINLPMSDFITMTFTRIIPVSFLIVVPPYCITIFFEECSLRFLLLTFISIVWSLFVVYYMGLTKHERNFVSEKLELLWNKLKS